MLAVFFWTGHAAATTVLVVFADGRASGGNWNNVTASGAAGLTDGDTGGPTAVAIGFTGKVNDSTGLGQWGTRMVAPEWTSGVTDAALTDRLYILEGDAGSMTLSGLVPGLAYDIELAAALGANELYDAQNRPAVLSASDSFTFTPPTVNRDTPVFLEFKATDSGGFSDTETLLVIINGPPRILEGPSVERIVAKNASLPPATPAATPLPSR